jgi:hypothetical protein
MHSVDKRIPVSNVSRQEPPGAVSYGAGVFAVVGAAGLAASVTQSLSLIIIIFEVTGQVYFIAPLIVTVVTAVLLSKRLSLSIYDQLMRVQPHLAAACLPQLPRWASKATVRAARVRCRCRSVSLWGLYFASVFFVQRNLLVFIFMCWCSSDNLLYESGLVLD